MPGFGEQPVDLSGGLGKALALEIGSQGDDDSTDRIDQEKAATAR